ncbi:MAG: heparinase II/III family protein [Caldilineaceae bacterium]
MQFYPAQKTATYTLPALGYDTSIFELSGQIAPGLHAWTRRDLLETLDGRATWEKSRQELHVYYYRINHMIAFPLPLAERPTQLPPGIPGRSWYPWLIWLLWALEERWRTLHSAWRHLHDHEAGALLQTELAALAGWRSFTAWNDEVGLPTGHLAGCFTYFLADKSGWDDNLYARAANAARRLVEEDVWPWYQKTWATERELTPHEIHNIPVIALVRGAQLARAIGFAHADVLEARALDTLRAWWRHRGNAEAPHTEGVSYDGFLMNSFTDWIDGLPNRAALLDEGSDAFFSLIAQWIGSTLPGRPDLHAPLGDVEGEMPFWITCTAYICDWYAGVAAVADGRWLLQHMSPARLPAAALDLLINRPELSEEPAAAPAPGPREVANAAILRTGWDSDDVLALVGLSRSPMSHLHNDGGQVIVSWRGRSWITDPGYQQYRPGAERDFTLDVAAHNAPVIDGIYQSKRAIRLLELSQDDDGAQRVTVDLTGGYEGLPDGAQVQRTVRLIPAADGVGFTVEVTDRITGFPARTEIATHWLGGAQLAWSFADGPARLSDGECVLWIESSVQPVDASMLNRHEGSRGPLTLIHRAPLAADGVHVWRLRGHIGARNSDKTEK